MARNMNFSASLRLDTKNFKKGISDVQRSLKSLQASFMSLAGALGIGMSFSRLGSTLMDTATKLSVAESALKNVSKGIGEYGESIEWLRKISNNYGQDMLALMKSFSQFRAAAATTNLSLQQMRDIYESLTRASGAFHLSSDEANNVMLAVTQMMSKGKVASEELRRQLGNSLPGAFSLMAQAAYNAGVITENSTAALEDAMKKGKVMADQVLPAFAKVLNDVTENANFDSLQSSINRFKNSWTEMVSSANFEVVYKTIIDGAKGVVEFFQEGFWSKLVGILAGLAGAIMMPKAFKKFMSGAKEMSAAAQVEFNKIYANAAALDEKLDGMLGNVRGMSFGKGFAKWKNSTAVGGYGYYKPTKAQYDFLEAAGVDVNKFKKTVADLNDEILSLNKASKDAGIGKIISNKDARALADYNKELKKTIKTTYEAPGAVEGLTTGVKGLNVVFNGLSSVLKKVGAAFRAAFSAIAIGAIIGLVTSLIGKLIEVRKETKRIDGIADDMVKKVNGAGGENNNTLIQLTRIKKALEDIDGVGGNDGKRAKLIGEVNKALGRTGDNLLTIEDDIKTKVIPAIDEYINKIKETARQQAILSQVNEATSKIIQLEAQNAKYTEDENYGKKARYQTGSIYSPIGGPVSETELLTPEAQKLQSKIDKNNREIAELNKGIDRIIKAADENTLNALYEGRDTVVPDPSGSTDDNKTKKATPKSVLDDYKKELQKLENQYKAGAILAADYEKQVEQLNQKSFQELASFGWDKVMKGLATSADKSLANTLKETAKNKLIEGLVDPDEIEEFDKAMEEEAEKAYREWKAAWDKFLEYRKKRPVIEPRNTDGDYMYSRNREKNQTYSDYEKHFIDEDLKSYEKYIGDLETYRDELKAAINDVADPATIQRLNGLLAETINKLELAKVTAKDLRDKANVAKLEKEIEDLRKNGIEAIFSDFTTLADGMDRMYRIIQNIQQINDSTWKSEELENFLTTLNAIIQVLEVMKTLYSALKTTEEIYAKIKEKNAMKEIALNGGVAISEEAKAAASAKAAAAGAAGATAGIPVVGPALAVGAVAAVVAAILAGMKKFANGGIVGGNSYYGDKQLARVNSSEMILTQGQQAKLWKFIQGGSNGGIGGGDITFRLKGTDIIGAIKNTQSRMRG